MSESSSSSGGIGLGAALGLLFIGLKLGGVIYWSWLWVLSPFWIPLGLILAFGAIVLVVMLIRTMYKIATR